MHTNNHHDFLRQIRLQDTEDQNSKAKRSMRARQTSLMMLMISALSIVSLAVLEFTSDGAMSDIMTERSLGKETEENDNIYDEGELNYFMPFYNMKEDKMKPGYLPLKKYPDGEGSVIATLVSSRPSDIEDLLVALKSLAFLKGDKDPEAPAPVLIFNEGDLSKENIEDIVASTDRPIGFPKVNFNSFPEGFDPDQEKASFPVRGREKWGYMQMIRFWTTMIWKHPAVQHFDTVMRIDSDSCFKEVNDYLPNFMYDGLYYHSQYVGVEPNAGVEYIDGILDFAKNYMETKQQPNQARNDLLWHYTQSVWEFQKTLPLFRTNFELVKRDFMQRRDVAQFNEALTEEEPFGVLRKRWGDAVLRFITMAVFENADRIMTIRPTGYFHKQGCSKEEVEYALEGLTRSSAGTMV